MNVNRSVADMPWWVEAIKQLGLVTIALVGFGWIAKENLPILVNGHVKYLEQTVGEFRTQSAIMSEQTHILENISHTVRQNEVVNRQQMELTAKQTEVLQRIAADTNDTNGRVKKLAPN